ncbi:MAG: ATP-binding protein [Desulfurivibrionaceae bacterium]
MGIRRGLNTRLSILLLVSALVICVAMIRYVRELLADDLRDKGEAIARLLSVVSMDAMLTHDYGNMERYVYQLVQDRDISLIRIRRADGEIMAEARSDRHRQENLRVSYPVGIGNSRIGEVEVLFSMERLGPITRKIVIFVVGLVAVIQVIGFLLNNLILHRLVLKPMESLISTARRWRDGALESRIELAGAREFNELAAAFNDMAGTLEKNFTELDQGKKAILTEKGKLETIVQSLADGLFVSAPDGVIISFNRAAESISGYTEDEALGLGCTELFKTRICADACALSNTDRTIRNKETEIIAKDGRRLSVSVSSAILRNSEGRVLGGVQTFRDITEEKARQAMFFQAEKLAAVGRLAAGLAHEINNPLGSIVGYAKLILKDQGLSGQSRERLGIIAEQARKGSEIVRGLLDFSRQSKGDRLPVAINDLLASVLKLLAHQAGKKGVSLEAEYTELPMIEADARQLEQVFYNLIANAVQAARESDRIVVKSSRPGPERVEVRISDNGPGILPEHRERIFEPFFTTKPAGEGTGLGLAISLGIVREHGGEIKVESEPGHGATFTVSLPG